MSQAHQALARKYRPQEFETLVGQDAVSKTLANALAARRVHHAYLFTGPRGCGKTTTARILAKALNCAQGPTPRPCGACVSCREIASSSCLDVLEMDAASHTGVDDVREVIVETVRLAPARDRYKIFIIDEAHMLSNSAFNALLKTIEEPPAHVVFMLATTEANKVPATIASRCQRFKFRPVPLDILRKHLEMIAGKESIDAEPDALELLSRVAEGSLRDAVSLLDQCRCAEEGRITRQSVRDMFGLVAQEPLLGIARALLTRDAKSLAGWLKKVYEEGIDPTQLLKDLRTGVEAVYLHKLEAGDRPEEEWSQVFAEASAEALGFLLRRINRALEEMRHGDSPRLALELGLFSALEAAHDLEQWVARLEALEKRLSAGGGGPALTPPTVAAAPSAPALSWDALVDAVAEQKISLRGVLASASGAVNGGQYTIRFAKAFDLDLAKRSAAVIEAALARLSGRPMTLSLELGAVRPAEPTEIVDTTAPEPPLKASAPAGARWKELVDEPGASTSGLKNAESVFGGKARLVRKHTPES